MHEWLFLAPKLGQCQIEPVADGAGTLVNTKKISDVERLSTRLPQAWWTKLVSLWIIEILSSYVYWYILDRQSKMAGLEILSPEGLRLDGRRPHELRKIVCRMGVFKQADGSAYIEMGNTKALATVYGPHEVTNKSKILHDRVLLNCQFSMATFSTGERKKRPKGDRKSTETSMLIRRTFDAAILTQMYPRSQIDIYVQVSRIFYIRLERV